MSGGSLSGVFTFTDVAPLSFTFYSSTTWAAVPPSRSCGGRSAYTSKKGGRQVPVEKQGLEWVELPPIVKKKGAVSEDEAFGYGRGSCCSEP